ncbi:hypothetical protein OUZ56_032251 [Daphnia magna]|uniref:Uncharacterized protein n=1 Tax=Daphnia magna TaxID=35525 RepID=A0ABQ9ZXM0_9CRUS|nr:hypothetical protein OUZ56_032251 [Daphnia magna]
MLVPHRLGGRGGPCVWSVGWKPYFGTDILLYLTSTTLLETSSVLSGENILRNFVIQICRNFYYMQHYLESLFKSTQIGFRVEIFSPCLTRRLWSINFKMTRTAISAVLNTAKKFSTRKPI